MSLTIEVSTLELWFRKNRRFVNLIFIAALTAGAFYTLHSYQHKARMTNASKLLSAAEVGFDSGNMTALQGAAETLRAEYADTDQASLAMLQLARLQAAKQQWKKSEDSIQWVITNATLPIFSEQARIQLSQIQIQNKQFDAALSTLKAPFVEKVFFPIVAELTGDILAIKGNSSLARSHYEQALHAQPEGHPYRELIQYKIDSLTL